MNNRGFTLLELLAIIVILAIILIIATPKILTAVDEAKKESFRITGENILDGAVDSAISKETFTISEKNYTITEGAFVGESLSITGNIPEEGRIEVKEDGSNAIAIYKDELCASKTFEQDRVVITECTSEECLSIFEPAAPAVSYTGYDATEGINTPVVTPGLTPVANSGASWINTTIDDPTWYTYTTTDKTWANAKTSDGSMWVWIPRFAYQINTNFHTNSGTGGVINIKFLKGNSNDAGDGTVIDTVPTYVGSSQTNYVVHPAFTFGGVELTGFWMAKFEATMGKAPNNPGTSCVNQLDNVTTETVSIVPNIASWRCISVSNAFLNSYNMQTKEATYGWSDSEVDTHLMRNSEWSAVAFLSQSSYGKGTTNIWMNPNSNYVTGCGGTAAGQSQTATCITYDVETRTSTTGNITGVYDMSGGSSEFTATYVDNLVVGGGTYINGQALMEANPKYREALTLGTTDTAVDNYNATTNVFGHALWETSSSGSVNNSGWYLDTSLMPYDLSPWLIRGSFNRSFNGAGLFAFDRSGGGGAPDYTFRPVVVVE